MTPLTINTNVKKTEIHTPRSICFKSFQNIPSVQDIFKQNSNKVAQFLVVEEWIYPHMGKASYNLVFVNNLPSVLLLVIEYDIEYDILI